MGYQIGQQIGNYRLLSVLGIGGFAEVYLGEHIHLGSLAAIKILSTRLSGKMQDDFKTEARFLAKLSHPHIVRILDFDIQEDIPFLVMDYATSGSLRQLYPRGSILSLETVLSYVQQVSAALQYAHDQQLVHRDIKPENMLLNKQNEVLLSDFGIASPSFNSSSQTVQEIVGTAPYMAPEQLEGRPRPASDQYALGIVVYEWLTGEPPFRGSFLEISSQHLLVPPASLRSKNPIISRAVEQVVLTTLAKESRLRFANMRAFAHAFQQATLSSTPEASRGVPFLFSITDSAAAHRPPNSPTPQLPILETDSESARLLDSDRQTRFEPAPLEIIDRPRQSSAGAITPLQRMSSLPTASPTQVAQAAAPTTIVRTMRFSRRKLIAGLSTLGIIGASYALYLDTHTLPNTMIQPKSSDGAMFGLNPQHTHVNTKEHILNTSNVSNLDVLWSIHLGGAISLSSPALANELIYIGSTNSHLYAVDSVARKVVWEFATDNEIYSSPAVSGGVVYFGSHDHYVYALNALNGNLLWKVQTGSSVHSSACVVNGVVYIGSDDMKLYALDALSGRILWEYTTRGGVESSPAVVNGIVYFGSYDNAVYALNVSNGHVIWKATTNGGILSSPSVVDGVVYIGSQDNQVYAFDITTGSILWSIPTKNVINSSPAVFGNTIYIGSKDNFLYAIDGLKHRLRWKMSAKYEIASSPTIANGVLYIGSWDYYLYVVDATTGTILKKILTGEGIESSPLVINGAVYLGARDGKLYAFGLPGE